MYYSYEIICLFVVNFVLFCDVLTSLRFQKIFVKIQNRSTTLRQAFISMQNIPAICGKLLFLCKTSLQSVGSFCFYAKYSCNLRQAFVSMQNVPAICRKFLFLCKMILQNCGKLLFVYKKYNQGRKVVLCRIEKQLYDSN